MLAGFFEGWLPNGIGEAQPYPTFYYVGFVLWPLHAILTPLAVAVVIVSAAIAIAAISAYRIGENRGLGSAAAVLAAFAVLNPWVYSELVAGHVVMVLAYSLLIALVAETTRGVPRTWCVLVLSALLITQIEFWLVAVIPFMAWCVWKKQTAAAVMCWLSALPVLVGIAASLHALAGTSYNLEWQQAQSVAPGTAVALLGYAFGYAQGFLAWRWIVILFALLGVTGIAAAWRYRQDRFVIVIAAACLLLATGTRGPLASLYSYAVTHIVESGVFRELFDLLAFTAIGYLVLAASALRRTIAAAAGAVLVVLLAVPWIAQPAFTWFVSARSLPASAAPRGSAYRVAYFPAFQPLTYQGRGSGVDPDALVQTGRLDPLNEATPTYPVDVALASAYSGDLRSLAALSVSQIVTRTSYEPDWRVLQYQMAFRRRLPPLRLRTRTVSALPPAVLYAGAPEAVTIGGTPVEDSITPEMDGAQLFRGDRTTLDPRRAWIDARATFVARPAWGNPWGGVATAGSAPLALPSGSAAVLAQTSGALTSDRNDTIAVPAPALHWWAVPGGAHAMTCTGECIVVAAAPQLPAGREHAAKRPVAALSLHVLTPWLATADVPSTSGGTLRYNVRYDEHWAAYAGATALQHVALDGTINGWIVPRAAGSRRVVLIEMLAALQLLLEIAAAVTLLFLLARLYFFSDKHRIGFKSRAGEPVSFPHPG